MTKQEAIFNKIVDVVTKDYFISREDFFSGSMKRALLDARNTVMWYALQKGLSIKQIANLMGKCLASVYYGIHSFETISRVDKFYSLKKQRIDKKLRIK